MSNISTEHFIGLAGSGATSGLAVGHFEWLACLILLLLGWVFVPFYLRSNVFTMPEFLERRFNRHCACISRASRSSPTSSRKFRCTCTPRRLCSSASSAGVRCTAAVILVIATGIYTIAGGLAAVIYTELVQTLILLDRRDRADGHRLVEGRRLRGAARRGAGGLLPHDQAVSRSRLSVDRHLFGAPILGIWYWCTDQVIVQRVLSAKDEGHAKAGTIFAGFLKILPVFLLVSRD